MQARRVIEQSGKAAILVFKQHLRKATLRQDFVVVTAISVHPMIFFFATKTCDVLPTAGHLLYEFQVGEYIACMDS